MTSLFGRRDFGGITGVCRYELNDNYKYTKRTNVVGKWLRRTHQALTFTGCTSILSSDISCAHSTRFDSYVGKQLKQVRHR